MTKKIAASPGLARTNTATTCGFISVGTASTTVLQANASRLELTLVNDGANVIYLMLNTSDGTTVPTAVAGSGIRLNANGGSWTSDAYIGPVGAIALTGATNLAVLEI